MENKNFWFTIVVVLIIVNVTTLGFVFFKNAPNSHQSPRDHHESRERNNRYLDEKLNLDKEQRRLFREERISHFSKLNPIEKKLRDSKYLLVESNISESPISKVKGELRNIGNLNRQIDSLNYEHFTKLRSICREGQKAQIDEMLKKMIDRRMRDTRPEKEGKRKTR